MFQMAPLLLKENNCAKLFWNPCVYVAVTARYSPDKLNFLLLYHLTFKCDPDLQPTWTNVSNGTYTPQGEWLCQIILKSMHKYRLWPQTSSIYYPFNFKCHLDLQPTWKTVSNGTSPPQLCHIISKSMHKCRSYGPDKSGRMHAPALHASASRFYNKTCHRDRIAHLTVPCPSHKKLLRKNLNILLTPTPPPMPTPTPGVVQ